MVALSIYAGCVPTTRRAARISKPLQQLGYFAAPRTCFQAIGTTRFSLRQFQALRIRRPLVLRSDKVVRLPRDYLIAATATAATARNLKTTSRMYVRELMQSDVVILSSTDSLGLADDIMRLGRIRHMPVVDEQHVVGILSQRDLFRAAISSVLEFRPTAEREWLAQIRVGELMTSPVQSGGAPE